MDITSVPHKRPCKDANNGGVDLSVLFLGVSSPVSQTESYLWPGRKRKWEEFESENSVEGNALQKKFRIPDMKSANHEEDGESCSVDGWFSVLILRSSCCIGSSTS